MSDKKAQKEEFAQKKKERKAQRKRFRLRSLLLPAFIFVVALLVFLMCSGWLLAQSARWPALGRVAERIAPLIPGKFRALGYKRALSSGNAEVRAAAQAGLDSMNEEDKDAIRNLVERLKSREEDVRRDAVEKLGKVDSGARETVPYIVDALRDQSAKVRAAAAEALGGLREKARKGIPALKEALGDKIPEVRDTAREAIRRITGNDIEPEEPEATPEEDRTKTEKKKGQN